MSPTSSTRPRRLAVGLALSGAVALGGLALPSPASAAPGAPVAALSSDVEGLRQGANGSAVAELQRALIQAGITVRGGADGVFGPATHRAVTAFQERQGLPTTGVVDATTAGRLDRAIGGDGAAGSEGFVGLEQGDRGEAVRELQRRLDESGVYVHGGADGIFGPATARALRQFQSWNGLGTTGTVTRAVVDVLDLGATSRTSSASRVSTASSSRSSSSGATSGSSRSSSNPFVGLRQGSNGDRVAQLQRALQKSGLIVVGGADGVFGPATARTLRAFEKIHGLTQDAVVGEREASLLGLDSSSTSSSSSRPSSGSGSASGDSQYVGLRVGDSGPAVVELQRALQDLGFVIRGGADGNFGGSTAYTLRAFQSVNGIAQTGIVSRRGARILKLGDEPSSRRVSNPGVIQLDRFPIQGLCFFADTWHAPRGNGRVHEGVDFIAAEGNLLYAVTDGVITTLWYDQPGLRAGNGVKLEQPDGTYFVYLHMQGFAPGIEVGTRVKAGDVLGTNGNTGLSATAHLHFEIHPGGGAAINPYPIVKAMDECEDTTPKWQASYL